MHGHVSVLHVYVVDDKTVVVSLLAFMILTSVQLMLRVSFGTFLAWPVCLCLVCLARCLSVSHSVFLLRCLYACPSGCLCLYYWRSVRPSMACLSLHSCVCIGSDCIDIASVPLLVAWLPVCTQSLAISWLLSTLFVHDMPKLSHLKPDNRPWKLELNTNKQYRSVTLISLLWLQSLGFFSVALAVRYIKCIVC